MRISAYAIFFLLGIIIGTILASKGCTNNCDTTIESTSDTTHYSHIDTTFLVVYDTLEYTDKGSYTFKDTLNKDSIIKNEELYTYIENFKDTTDKGILKGTVVINTFSNSLKNWNIDWEYNSTIPIKNTETTINKVDTFIINNTNKIFENKRKLYAGIEIDIQPINHIYLGADYLDKKGNMFGIAVGTDLNEKQMFYKIGYKRLINFK